MFRTMRRKNQELSLEESISILCCGSSGVLAVSGDDSYPYAVPLSYVYQDSKLYFHCAKTGHKLDAITKNPKVSFCVIGQDKVVPEEYTTYFRSVIVFGIARIIEEESEKRNAIELLAKRYCPNDEKGRKQEIEREYQQLCMVEISIEHISGKEAIELVQTKHDDESCMPVKL
ncbi:pyridoxamine 5'-phosphate oxidase family protein [Massilioclostridium coli]|uniref:pyridoxamine 5'-phosphate oxidase family protein n=1 Tax=Massilioclostridium coli TaxID=1870991 RepID=UPI00085C3860|nr:pyridoxamine 5'-phosphate oxidase family protein [Massilioclostridium coli]